MEDAFGNRIVFEDQDKTQFYAFEMKRVLAAVAFFMSDDPENWLKKCWVSDGSRFSDFRLQYEDIVRIAETLGVPVAQDDYLWEIARKIHEKEA